MLKNNHHLIHGYATLVVHFLGFFCSSSKYKYLVYNYIILSNSNNFQTDQFDGSQSDTTIPGQSGPKCNSNEMVTPLSPKIQN